MKILYGVQGTGHGHISRANAMADQLQRYPNLDITWLLSGREKERGCGSITDFEWREGLTFVVENGKINPWQTLQKNSIRGFLRDVAELDLTPYDLVITDYEPVIAHAARKRGVPTIGIGHQYAFRYPIPLSGHNPVLLKMMNWFGAATRSVGLHWHHFDQPILPPILDIEIPNPPPKAKPNKVIIYLPFENPKWILDMLSGLTDYDFYIYHPALTDQDNGHLHQRAISRFGFKQDLMTANAVVCNSGFELISECLCLGKAILTKPLLGQMEQHSNAAALAQLGYATVRQQLDAKTVQSWLKTAPQGSKVLYPNVARALADWIAKGCPEQDLATDLWRQTLVVSSV